MINQPFALCRHPGSAALQYQGHLSSGEVSRSLTAPSSGRGMSFFAPSIGRRFLSLPPLWKEVCITLPTSNGRGTCLTAPSSGRGICLINPSIGRGFLSLTMEDVRVSPVPPNSRVDVPLPPPMAEACLPPPNGRGISFTASSMSLTAYSWLLPPSLCVIVVCCTPS